MSAPFVWDSVRFCLLDSEANSISFIMNWLVYFLSCWWKTHSIKLYCHSPNSSVVSVSINHASLPQGNMNSLFVVICNGDILIKSIPFIINKALSSFVILLCVVSCVPDECLDPDNPWRLARPVIYCTAALCLDEYGHLSLGGWEHWVLPQVFPCKIGRTTGMLSQLCTIVGSPISFV